MTADSRYRGKSTQIRHRSTGPRLGKVDFGNIPSIVRARKATARR